MINRWYFGPPSQTIPELLRDLGHRPRPATGDSLQLQLILLRSNFLISSPPRALLSPADTYQLCGCLWWGMQCRRNRMVWAVSALALQY